MPRIPVRQAAAVIAVIALLSACAIEPSRSPDAPSVEERVHSESPVEADPAPIPLLDLSCEELLPAGVGAGLLTEPLPPLANSSTHLFESFARPDAFATEQARGTYCTTSNGEPHLTDENLNPAWVAIEARVIPNATEQFALFEEVTSQGGTVPAPFINCSGGIPASCSLDQLVGEHWVHFYFWGIRPSILEESFGRPTQLVEVASVASAVVDAAALNDEDWSVPSTTVPLGAECEQFFSADRVADDLGISDEIFLGLYEDYEAAERAGRELAPALSCPWLDINNRMVGGHSTLQGGEWALQSLIDDGHLDDWATFDLEGLASEGLAIYSCTEVAGGCVTNLIIGHNWVQLWVFTDENGLDAASATERLRGFAQSAVDAIRA